MKLTVTTEPQARVQPLPAAVDLPTPQVVGTSPEDDEAVELPESGWFFARLWRNHFFHGIATLLEKMTRPSGRERK